MRRSSAALLLSFAVLVASNASAQPSEADADAGGVQLSDYYNALAERRLIARETGSAEGLAELVRRGRELYFDNRFEEASRLLYEAVESPRFTDFESLEDYRNAEFMLAGSLQQMGALRSAWRYLIRIVQRGPEDPYFGPAFRRSIDVALVGASLPTAMSELESLTDNLSLPADAENELLYLRGRSHYDVHEWAQASAQFEQIGRRSRFYANARYLQGAIAAQAGRFEDAESHFCAIASTPDTDQYTFFVDQRYFEIRDLTWLGLGRVAHEARRPDDAFYYYFQVPQDSARVSEALFESAWAMYEGDDFDTAIDLLDQLDARFPDSPFSHEATLLRGYIHLGRCEFENADQLFRTFQDRFTPVVHEADRILESPARQAQLFEELIAAESARASSVAPPSSETERSAPTDVHALLLSLLEVDPEFFRLYTEIRSLDAEAARAGRTASDLGAILGRFSGSDAPRQAAAEVAELDESTALRRDLEGAQSIVRALTGQLEAMRAAGAEASQLDPLERELAQLSQRVRGLDRRLSSLVGASGQPSQSATAESTDIEAMLRRDRVAAENFTARVAQVRGRLVDASNHAALEALRSLRSSLGGHLRRSRIGRIDAVMGSKRRIEIQIESLAAGRFPAELTDPLSIQGLLRDNEEYWPFEGEYWADEFEEDEADGDEADGDEPEPARGDEAAVDEDAQPSDTSGDSDEPLDAAGD